MEFIFKYHPAWLILTTIIAFGYAFFLYRKDNLLDEVASWVKWMLGIFRFASVWIILLLLLGIILEHYEDRKEKPLVFIAHDNSESVALNKDSLFYKGEYIENLRSISQDLSEEFEVIEYSFSDVLDNGFKSDYSGKMTNVSNVFDQIFDQYTNRNIGAIVLSTDGIYNTGANPVYALSRKSFIPVYTVGLGDTNEVKDVKIDAVLHNDIAFLGNQFPVEVTFSQSKSKGEKVKVGIYENDKLIKETDFSFKGEQEQFKANFVLNASKTGYRKYAARVTVLDNEFNEKNNRVNFYVEVIDGRQKILIAYQSPNPDVGAMRFVIENNKNYEVDVLKFDEVKSLQGYDLVIAHNYQDDSKVLADAVNSGSVPMLFILGESTDMRSLQNKQLGFNGSGSGTEELGFAVNPAFREILLSAELVQTLSSAPPLHGPFGNYKFSSAVDVLAYRKVGNIQLDQPLIYFTKKGGNRLGVITGEGIWRWRLSDQLRNGSTANFEELITKLITYLAIKENKDPFRIQIDNEYNENEKIVVEAELYNKSFELINEPEVEFNVTNEEGSKFEFHFVRTTNAYRLDIGKLSEGLYQWESKTQFQGQNFRKTGNFLVKEIKLELLNSTADHRILKNIAENSGGRFYLPAQMNELSKDLKENEELVTVVYQEKSFDDLIDYWWLFIVIFVLMSVEWFVRKYQGAY